jgi:hypothetical protein
VTQSARDGRVHDSRSRHRLQEKAPALEPGPVAMEEEDAAPHHVWDSTIKVFRSFTANLREIHVESLAVRDLGRFDAAADDFSLAQGLAVLVHQPWVNMRIDDRHRTAPATCLASDGFRWSPCQFLSGQIENCTFGQLLRVAPAALSHCYDVFGEDCAASGRVIFGCPGSLALLDTVPRIFERVLQDADFVRTKVIRRKLC